MQKRGKRREEKKKSDTKKHLYLLGLNPSQDLKSKREGEKKRGGGKKALHRI